MYYHHGTIRKYVAALLSTFNGTEIQYQKSDTSVVSKSIPLTYITKEKSRILDDYTAEQVLSGNYNVLPKASLALTSLTKSPERTGNKNAAINRYKTEDTVDYLYNSVSYIFGFELVFQCRGMNEVTQIVEQICPKFNPTVNIDIWDATNLNEATRVPVTLDSVDIQDEEYSEISSNIFNIVFSLSLKGNMYPPIQSIERIKEFKIRINEYDNDNLYDKKSVLGWEVDASGNVINGEINHIVDPKNYPPVIESVSIDGGAVLGANKVILLYKDIDDMINELTFDWQLISGNALLEGDKDSAVLTINAAGSVEIMVSITDPHGNYASINQTFVV